MCLCVVDPAFSYLVAAATAASTVSSAACNLTYSCSSGRSPVDGVWPTATGWWVLLGVGCFTQLGQLALTKAMQRDAASRVTSLSYVQIIFAAILGWTVFGEVPTQATLLGGAFILLGAIVSAWMQPRAATEK